MDRWFALFLANFFILFGYTVIIYGLYYFFSKHIKLSEVLPITNWDNLRSLGLTFASHIAVPFAAIGYFLSSRCSQAMQKGNDIQSSMQVSTLFIVSQRMIDSKEVAAIGAISVLVRLGRKMMICEMPAKASSLPVWRHMPEKMVTASGLMAINSCPILKPH